MNLFLVEAARLYYARRGIEPTDHDEAYALWAAWAFADVVGDRPESKEAALAKIDAWVAAHVNKSELVAALRDLAYEAKSSPAKDAALALLRRANGKECLFCDDSCAARKECECETGMHANGRW